MAATADLLPVEQGLPHRGRARPAGPNLAAKSSRLPASGGPGELPAATVWAPQGQYRVARPPLTPAFRTSIGERCGGHDPRCAKEQEASTMVDKPD